MSENTKIKVYGIDLGTTYSAISHVGDSGNVEIINNPGRRFHYSFRRLL